MNDRVALLAQLSGMLGPLPDQAVELCVSARPTDLAKGKALLREGERWQQLWWLERGALRLYYLDREGRGTNKNFYLDGATIWPITPALRSQPVHFWVETLELSRIWALEWDRWSAAIAGFAPWQALEHRVLSALLQEKMAREHAFLQLTATERYLALQNEHPDWVARIPLRHLASWLGVTDVALSRIRRRLNSG
jgi:CRP-like cAMP-binding protein